MTSPVEAAHWLAWATLVLVGWIVLSLLVLRWLKWREEPRKAAFQAHWRPLLMRCMMGEDWSAPLPRLAVRERRPFLQLWLRCQLSVQGPARDRLARLGLDMGLQTLALAQMRSSHYAERMTGMLALGFLQDAAATPLLQQRLADGNNHTVIFASRALLEIDHAAHAHAVAQALVAEPALDFSLVSVLLKPWRQPLGSVLLHMPPQAPSANAAAAADVSHLHTLNWLRLARALQLQVPHAVLTPLLKQSQDIDTLINAIRLSQGERGTDAVSAHARHPDWRVRAQVANALGFIGSARDMPLLASLTADAQWWVRHRAAQALLRIPRQGVQEVLGLVAGTQDRYAIEMVQAEIARTGRA